MKAGVFDGNQIKLIDIPKPQLTREDDILIEIKSSGICGSDLRILFGETQPHTLPIGLLSQNAKEITTKEYAKSITNRNESLIDKIENDLDVGKNGILFMRDDHGLQFSKDVEVFYVSTTIINSLQNWLGEELNKFMNPGAAEN